MAIVNKLTTLMPAFGAPTEYVTLVGQNLPTGGPTSFVLTGFANFIRSGRLRIKSTAAGTALITVLNVTGTDGSTTVTLVPIGGTTTTASQVFDFLFSFISELNLTTITVAITMGAGTASTIDLEVTGNP